MDDLAKQEQDHANDTAFDLEEENSGITETEDGGAIIEMEEVAEIQEAKEHFTNLAADMPKTELGAIAIELIDLVEQDKKSREKRDEVYAEGIKRTGLGDEAPGGADFQGASKVVHPLLTEVCVDFSARVMKELFPASGPVKQHIPGTSTKEKVEKSHRKTKHMNWQFTKQIKEFRSELEQTLTQVPLGGAAYLKISFDERHKRPQAEFVAIDDIFYPFAASSFLSAERITHQRKMTELKYKRLVKDGVYLDEELGAPTEEDISKSEKASDKIEGKTKDDDNRDGLRTIWEIQCYLNFEDEEEYDPYIVTIDLSSKKVMSIYRNWDAEDEHKEAIQHIVEFPFVPWRGAAPIGITHMIGSISGAATGALRALLDSAHINNQQSGVKLEGGQKSGQTVSAKATEIKNLEGGIGTDDIRKLFMPMPFNPPSPVLFQLLGFLVEQGKGVVQTTFEGIADQKTDMPVGTTLALIEQGMTVFSAIHGRLHNSMQQVFAIVHRLNAKHITTQEIKDDLGEVIARARDYQGPMDVMPVSDPAIFSEVQRQAQIALIAQRAATFPMLYNLHKVEKMILEYAKFPDPQELLNPVKEPMKDNAVNENVKATMSTPLIAFPEQNHEAHIATHLAYMNHPIFGSSPLIAPSFIPTMVAHLRDHITYWYLNKVIEDASAAADMDVSDLMDADHDVSKKFDEAMQIASANVLEDTHKEPNDVWLAAYHSEGYAVRSGASAARSHGPISRSGTRSSTQVQARRGGQRAGQDGASAQDAARADDRPAETADAATRHTTQGGSFEASGRTPATRRQARQRQECRNRNSTSDRAAQGATRRVHEDAGHSRAAGGRSGQDTGPDHRSRSRSRKRSGFQRDHRRAEQRSQTADQHRRQRNGNANCCRRDQEW